MTQPTQLSRRRFLKYSVASAGVALAGTSLWPSLYADAGFVPDIELQLSAVRTRVRLFSGRKTNVFSYQGRLLKGPASALQTIPGSYLGPVIRVRPGQKIRVHFHNRLAEESIIHWHGLHIPETMDGHPRYAVGPGKSYVYEFEVKNRAGTYWFHPHPHEKTGRQVYGGLAGLFIVSDDEEQALRLPAGKYDIPLVIQDRRFNHDNQLVYLTHMMDRMMGFKGDRILVNGQADFVLPVETRPYRLRLLNGSNSRIYKLAWSDNSPFTVIGTDGGLLAGPVTRKTLTLAPAERIELWVDFSDRKTGTEILLNALPFDDGSPMGRMGMMGMMGSRQSGQKRGFTVMKVRVTDKVTHKHTLPTVLSKIGTPDTKAAVNADAPRRFDLTMAHMQWGINHRTFSMNQVARNEIVRLGTRELWEFRNVEAMGMMGMRGGMPHPVHVHGLQFRIVERSNVLRDKSAWNSIRTGYVDEGWKDSFLVMPGERVRLLLEFTDYKGKFLYHCHNLEHEDMGMMRNYLVS